jgi:hypothetical protein
MRAETASNLEVLFMVSFSKCEHNISKEPQFPLRLLFKELSKSLYAQL